MNLQRLKEQEKKVGEQIKYLMELENDTIRDGQMHYYFGSVLAEIHGGVDSIRKESENNNDPEEAKLVPVYEKALSEAVEVVVKSLEENRSRNKLSKSAQRDWEVGEKWQRDVSGDNLKKITDIDAQSIKDDLEERVEKLNLPVDERFTRNYNDSHFPRTIVGKTESWAEDRAQKGEWSPIGKFPVASDETANILYARAVCFVADELCVAAIDTMRRDENGNLRQPQTNKRLRV